MTVQGLGVPGEVDGCTTYRHLRVPVSSWSASDVLPGLKGPKVFDGAHTPRGFSARERGERCRQGWHRQRGGLQPQAADLDSARAAQRGVLHVAHSSSVAARLRLVFKDARGHVVPERVV